MNNRNKKLDGDVQLTIDFNSAGSSIDKKEANNFIVNSNQNKTRIIALNNCHLTSSNIYDSILNRTME